MLQGKEGIQAAQTLTEQITGEPWATIDEVKVANPTTGDQAVHGNEDTRTADAVKRTGGESGL